MTRIENLLLPLLLWCQTILLYAVFLGLEGPALLLAAYRYRRPRAERLVAIVPVAAFCALLVVARALLDTYTYWRAYTAWILLHYPPAYLPALLNQTAQGTGQSTNGVATLGIGLSVLTALLLVGGWALLLRWQSPPPIEPHTETPTAATPTGEDPEALEITVEPLEVAGDISDG